jgi:hypothetical protein
MDLNIKRRQDHKCNVPAVTRKIYGKRQKLPEDSLVQDRRTWNYLEEKYSLIIVTQQLRPELSSRINSRLTPRP